MPHYATFGNKNVDCQPKLLITNTASTFPSQSWRALLLSYTPHYSLPLNMIVRLSPQKEKKISHRDQQFVYSVLALAAEFRLTDWLYVRITTSLKLGKRNHLLCSLFQLSLEPLNFLQ